MSSAHRNASDEIITGLHVPLVTVVAVFSLLLSGVLSIVLL
jgi:hypothetical protein